jgi:hypothetical protein
VITAFLGYLIVTFGAGSFTALSLSIRGILIAIVLLLFLISLAHVLSLWRDYRG